MNSANHPTVSIVNTGEER